MGTNQAKAVKQGSALRDGMPIAWGTIVLSTTEELRINTETPKE